MKALLAVGTLLVFSAALCSAAGQTEAAERPAAAEAALAGRQYNAEAVRFERQAETYAMAARQYLAAGKPITTALARRAADYAGQYRQLAARDRDLARRARPLSQ